mgnify:CR=1 FL=1
MARSVVLASLLTAGLMAGLAASAEAREKIETALGMVEHEMQSKTWAMGDSFTMADCAAAPALFYANQVSPFAKSHPHAFAYYERLMQRPSYARVQKEAEPYLANFPRS